MKKVFLLANLYIAFGLTAPRILFAESGLIFDQTQGTLTGQLNVTSNVAAAGSVTASSATLTNTAGAGLAVSSSAYLAVSGGNVGIGTTSPGYKLQVEGDIAAGPTGKYTFSGNGWGTDKIVFRQDVNNKVYSDPSGNWSWTVAGKNWSLPDVGNVGIGTTAPGGSGGNVDFRFPTSVVNRGSGVPAQLFVSDSATSQAADGGGRIDLGGWSAGLAKPYTWGGIKGAAEAATGNKGYLSLFTQATDSTLTERVRIDGTGNVGIGTTSWTNVDANASNLVIAPNTVNGGITILNDATHQGNIMWSRGSGANAYVARINYDHNTDMMLFRAGAVDTMYLKAGNVGIGTTAPASKLHIQGTAGAVSGAAKAVVQIADDSAMAAGVGGAITFLGKYTAAGAIVAGSYIQAQKTNATEADYSFDLALGTRENGYGVAERMRITNTGNVGIGATGPTSLSTYKTEIYGANPLLGLSGSVNGLGQLVGLEFNQMTTSPPQTRPGGAIKSVASGTYTGGSGGTYNSDLAFYTGTGGSNTEQVRILSSGNVGIGTTTPVGTLEISNSYSGTSQGGEAYITNTYSSGSGTRVADLTFRLTDSVGTNKNVAMMQALSNNHDSSNGDNLLFYTRTADAAPTEKVRIDNNGNVGIGTTAPRAKLDVAGGVRLANDAGTCDASKAGTIRWTGTFFQGCSGAAWITFGMGTTGTVQTQAGRSCGKIMADGFSTGSGVYWIDPDNDGNTSNAFQVYCDMTTNGGGWTMVYQNLFSGNEGGPSPGDTTSVYGTAGYHSDYGVNTQSVYSAIGATQMLLMDDSNWLKFTLTSAQFNALWNISGDDTYSITSINGSTYTRANGYHGHTSGVNQFGTATNSGTIFEYNYLKSGQDTNHYWHIWPAGDGAYAISNGVSGDRWGAILIR